MKNYTEHADVLAALAQADFGTLSEVRYAPTSFDPKDPGMSAFPYSRKDWDSARRALKTFSSRTVMVRLPLFWQVHAALHAACRSVSAAMYTNALNNAPVGMAAIQGIEVDTIVSEATAAELFAHDIQSAGVQKPISWLIIHKPDTEWTAPAILRKQGHVAQEAHLLPGIVLLEQCDAQITSKSNLFHLREDFVWDMSQDATCVSDNSPVPFTRYKLPFILIEIGSCSCGKLLYTKKI